MALTWAGGFQGWLVVAGIQVVAIGDRNAGISNAG